MLLSGTFPETNLKPDEPPTQATHALISSTKLGKSLLVADRLPSRKHQLACREAVCEKAHVAGALEPNEAVARQVLQELIHGARIFPWGQADCLALGICQETRLRLCCTEHEVLLHNPGPD